VAESMIDTHVARTPQLLQQAGAKHGCMLHASSIQHQAETPPVAWTQQLQQDQPVAQEESHPTHSGFCKQVSRYEQT
jgi:hypothetical protein